MSRLGSMDRVCLGEGMGRGLDLRTGICLVDKHVSISHHLLRQNGRSRTFGTSAHIADARARVWMRASVHVCMLASSRAFPRALGLHSK
eukprot:4566863-Pleurochrysis_carterae.AAC.1